MQKSATGYITLMKVGEAIEYKLLPSATSIKVNTNGNIYLGNPLTCTAYVYINSAWIEYTDGTIFYQKVNLDYNPGVDLYPEEGIIPDKNVDGYNIYLYEGSQDTSSILTQTPVACCTVPVITDGAPDSKFLIWNGTTTPTTENEPYTTWLDPDTRDEHIGDYYIDSYMNYYEFKKDMSGELPLYYWEKVTDEYLLRILSRTDKISNGYYVDCTTSSANGKLASEYDLYVLETLNDYFITNGTPKLGDLLELISYDTASVDNTDADVSGSISIVNPQTANLLYVLNEDENSENYGLKMISRTMYMCCTQPTSSFDWSNWIKSDNLKERLLDAGLDIYGSSIVLSADRLKLQSLSGGTAANINLFTVNNEGTESGGIYINSDLILIDGTVKFTNGSTLELYVADNINSNNETGMNQATFNSWLAEKDTVINGGNITTSTIELDRLVSTGGYTIDDNGIYVATSYANEVINRYGTGLSGNVSKLAFWAGSKVKGYTGDIDQRPKFAVTHDGYLYANNANIEGTITSESGTIGGYTINSDGLSNYSDLISDTTYNDGKSDFKTYNQYKNYLSINNKYLTTSYIDKVYDAENDKDTYLYRFSRWGILQDGGVYFGNVPVLDENGYTLREEGLTYWKTKTSTVFNANGSGHLAFGKILWDATGLLSVDGKITATEGTIGGCEISDSSISTDGWRLNKDGSGYIASGDLSWDSEGTITMFGNVVQRPTIITPDNLDYYTNPVASVKTVNGLYVYYTTYWINIQKTGSVIYLDSTLTNKITYDDEIIITMPSIGESSSETSNNATITYSGVYGLLGMASKVIPNSATTADSDLITSDYNDLVDIYTDYARACIGLKVSIYNYTPFLIQFIGEVYDIRKTYSANDESIDANIVKINQDPNYFVRNMDNTTYRIYELIGHEYITLNCCRVSDIFSYTVNNVSTDDEIKKHYLGITTTMSGTHYAYGNITGTPYTYNDLKNLFSHFYLTNPSAHNTTVTPLEKIFWAGTVFHITNRVGSARFGGRK